MNYRNLVQYARWKGNPEILKNLESKEVGLARVFLNNLEEPLYQRWIATHNLQKEGRIECEMYYSLLTPPTASDPLLNTTLRSFVDEFLDYLEKEYFAVINSRDCEILISTFEPINIREAFWDFLQTVYDDRFLERRWELIKSSYRLKLYKIPSPSTLRDIIIEENIHLEVENQSGSFGDHIKSCMFCGRESITYEAKQGYVDYSSQRPQSKDSTKNPYICPICIFSIFISPIRVSMSSGSTRTDFVALETRSDERDKFSHIFNRIFGVCTGSYITVTSLGRAVEKYGTTILTYLSSSRIPLSTLADKDFNIVNLFTGSNLDKKRIFAIKAFESVLGYKVFNRARYNQSLETRYRKALEKILKGDYFSLIQHVGILAQSINPRKREVILDDGIYKLVKYEVIKMEERPDIVFGTALLIDAFLPFSWSKKNDDLKTDVRKVAYYLEKPEQVLYRLMQIKNKDYATLKRDFNNKAQFKLLKDFLTRIHQEEDLGDFEKEQTQRRERVEEISGKSYDESERLFLYHDDILKVYMYIQRLLADQCSNPKELKRNYSDIMNRVKYALIAKRPELLGGI